MIWIVSSNLFNQFSNSIIWCDTSYLDNTSISLISLSFDRYLSWSPIFSNINISYHCLRQKSTNSCFGSSLWISCELESRDTCRSNSPHISKFLLELRSSFSHHCFMFSNWLSLFLLSFSLFGKGCFMSCFFSFFKCIFLSYQRFLVLFDIGCFFQSEFLSMISLLFFFSGNIISWFFLCSLSLFMGSFSIFLSLFLFFLSFFQISFGLLIFFLFSFEVLI